MEINQQAVVLMLVAGSAWGFCRLICDLITGTSNIILWVRVRRMNAEMKREMAALKGLSDER